MNKYYMHNGTEITHIFLNGLFEYYSESKQAFLKFDTYESCCVSIDEEVI